MKILIVAMSGSIHTARWLRQISDIGWEIHLFPSIDYSEAHSELENITVHHMFYCAKKSNRKIRQTGFRLWSKLAVSVLRYIFQQKYPLYRHRQLTKLIKKLNPDVIHSMEMQHAGYLVHEVKKNFNYFPPWIVTNWGSDIYLYSRLKEHRQQIIDILSSCEYYSCECARDADLARELGFKGHVLPIVPNTGGMENYLLELCNNSVVPSKRRKIMLKGYHGWSGRALVAVRALANCGSLLQDYEIVAYSVGADVAIALELLALESGLNIKILPERTPRAEIVYSHSNARISIGLAISDGISTSMLEAMSVGSFVIQSKTSCASEWIQHGKNGLLVHPEEPGEVAFAIQKALLEDELVDRAALINQEIVSEKLDENKIAKIARSFYEIAANRH